MSCWWWLRSPGFSSYTAAGVGRDHFVSYDGNIVDDSDKAVRPALKISNLASSNSIKYVDNNNIVYCGVTWTKLNDDDLYISQMPIVFRRFDWGKSNDYATSEIRQFLLGWHEERKGW